MVSLSQREMILLVAVVICIIHCNFAKTVFHGTKKPCTKHKHVQVVIPTKKVATTLPKTLPRTLPSKTKTPCTKKHRHTMQETTSRSNSPPSSTNKIEATELNSKPPTEAPIVTTTRCKAVDCVLSGWSEWSPCSSTCGNTGLGHRHRKIKFIPLCGGVCPYPLQETRSCNRLCLNGGLLSKHGCECQAGYDGVCCEKVNGNWSPWGPWSKCTKSCDGGTQKRMRTCSQPTPANGGVDCAGVNEEILECNKQECPVNGGWDSWGDWSQCSSTCGEGRKFRQRQCNNPFPSNGGLPCIGLMMLTAKCQVEPCKIPVDGGWSTWLEWGQCSKTCDKGSRVRVRLCNNPLPSHGGRECSGNTKEEEKCYARPCKIPGNGGAGAEGGMGKRQAKSQAKRHTTSVEKRHAASNALRHETPQTTRDSKRHAIRHAIRHATVNDNDKRTLSNSHAGSPRRLLSYEGKDLVENFDVLVQRHTEETLQRDDNANTAGPWSSWSTCSATCGAGQRFRTRACSDLANPCSGVPMDVQTCSLGQCID